MRQLLAEKRIEKQGKKDQGKNSRKEKWRKRKERKEGRSFLPHSFPGKSFPKASNWAKEQALNLTPASMSSFRLEGVSCEERERWEAGMPASMARVHSKPEEVSKWRPILWKSWRIALLGEAIKEKKMRKEERKDKNTIAEKRKSNG